MNLSSKRVLVTGADGFIGSHLCQALVRNGAKVRALTLYNSFGSYGWLDAVEERSELEIVVGDIRDPDVCREILSEIEVVFHLAALIAIPYSYKAPQSYVATNVTGTANLCMAARDGNVERFVHTSTSEVYGTAQYVPMDESHPLQPQSPYSASKIGADCIALSMWHAFGVPVVVARPFNTYGPRQSGRAVIPTILSQLIAGSEEIQLGDLRPTRDFTYVEDTCRGLMSIATQEEALGEVVNIGSGFEVSIGDLAEEIRRVTDSEFRIVTDSERLRPPDSEVFRLWCDNSKIRAMTGFEPKFSLGEGLRRTYEWLKNPGNLAKYRIGSYVL